MSTYRHTDLESLIEDLKQIRTAETPQERSNLLTEIQLKIGKHDLETLYVLCDSFVYNYEKVFYQ